MKAFAQAGSVDVSPDGGRLAFVSSEAQNQFVVMVCDLPSCTNRQRLPLPTNFSPGTRSMRWTPDGRSIAYGHQRVEHLVAAARRRPTAADHALQRPPGSILRVVARREAPRGRPHDNDQRHRAVEGIEEVGEGPAEAGHYEPLEKLDSSCSNPALGPVGLVLSARRRASLARGQIRHRRAQCRRATGPCSRVRRTPDRRVALRRRQSSYRPRIASAFRAEVPCHAARTPIGRGRCTESPRRLAAAVAVLRP